MPEVPRRAKTAEPAQYYIILVLAAVGVLLSWMVAGASAKEAVDRANIAEQRFATSQEEVALLRAQLSATEDQLADKIHMERQLQALTDEVAALREIFRPEIPLEFELQAYTQAVCRAYDVPYDQVLRRMWRESGYQNIGDTMDTNGYYSTGRMMINQGENNSIWDWLAGLGLDVHDERDNIHAGVLIQAMFRQKYSDEMAVVALQCGEGKMLRDGITSTEYSRFVVYGELDFRLKSSA